jgi:hypothetical protein
MANFFISYGDDKFKKSIKLIKKEAREIGIFDFVKAYTPHDLPESIKSSPLYLFKKGGGYWIWKPYIIYDALQHCKENDIVYYADAGCTLNKNSKEWKIYIQEMKTHNAIFFQYRSNVQYDGWDIFCKSPSNNSPKIIHWMKPSVIEYFTEQFGSQDFLKYNKIWGGAIIIKKTPQLLNILDQWIKISLFHPELICDPFGKDLSCIPDTFNVHRHDQAILTPLVYHYKDIDNILVIPESSESQKANAAIIASRRVIWTWNLFDKIQFYFKNLFNRLFI